ncbi:DUF6179 domain-containing protein [Butyricicoccus sp.]|uniref:DUF6179 domain-containing protein n=1 Tax=Butyricicoccus sp. TaxID=2049021 RepID=UPI0037350620
MNEFSLTTEKLTAGQALVIQRQLYTLAAKQAEKYTSGESSSIPSELAGELLDSICFCLEQHEDGVRVLLHCDGAEALAEGMRRIERKQAYGKALWQEVCNHLPAVENRSMLDTLGGIGTFWKQYNPRFFAHQVPGDIDYQLSAPVSEQLRGVDYVNRYLEHLAIENGFLRLFTERAMLPVLDSYCPDYNELLVNLYEPIAANALGCVLLGRDVRSLDIPPEGYKALQARFSDKTTDEIRKILCEAAEELSEQLAMSSASAREYLQAYAERLVPRISAVRTADGLFGIFPSGKNPNTC